MIVDLEELRRVELRPGDVLVLRLDHLPDEDVLDGMRATLERVLPEHQVLVLGPGADLEVITPTTGEVGSIVAAAARMGEG